MIKHSALLLAFTAALHGQVTVEPTPVPPPSLPVVTVTIDKVSVLLVSLDHALALVQRARRLQTSVDKRDGLSIAEVAENRRVYNAAEAEIKAQIDYWQAVKDSATATAK